MITYLAAFFTLALATLALHLLTGHAAARYRKVRQTRAFLALPARPTPWAGAFVLGKYGRVLTGVLALAALVVAVAKAVKT